MTRTLTECGSSVRLNGYQCTLAVLLGPSRDIISLALFLDRSPTFALFFPSLLISSPLFFIRLLCIYASVRAYKLPRYLPGYDIYQLLRLGIASGSVGT
jgi:hypothetical protein